MGTIFAARHLENGELFALKVLTAKALASSQATPRFLREARALARLRGPHVATVHEIARLPTGAPCMVMEYLRGADLQEILSRGVPSLRDTLEWMIQACEGVALAHASDIVHRDIKPANLFVSPLPEGRSQVRVLDFGIAKLAERDGPFDHELTQVGMVFGSPSYMSPEQMRQTRDVDARTDVWSLGVVLYEMLTGTLPFSPAAGAMDLVVRVAAEAPPRPIELRPDVPPALDAAVMRCLEKRREARFQTATELAETLREVLATLPPAEPVLAASFGVTGAIPPAPISVRGAVPPAPISMSEAAPLATAPASGVVPPAPISVSGGVPPAPISVRGAVPPAPISVSEAVPLAPISVRGAVPPAPISVSSGAPPGGAPPPPEAMPGTPAGAVSGSALPDSLAGVPGPTGAAPARRGAPRWAVAVALAAVAIAVVSGLFLRTRDAAPDEPTSTQNASPSATGAPAPPSTSDPSTSGPDPSAAPAQSAPDPSAAPADSAPDPSASAEPSAEPDPGTSAEPSSSGTAPAPGISTGGTRPPRTVRPVPPKTGSSFNACFTTADCRRGKKCIQGWCK